MRPRNRHDTGIALRWILALFGLVLLGYTAEYLVFNRYNQSPLSIETTEGTGQAYHPSVLFCDIPWNGYEYWMAETPYPIDGQPYRDRWECPSIHVSRDGIHWQQPECLTNPIDDLSPSEISNHDFFSDPHLVMKDGRLECFYRYSRRTEEGYCTSLIRRTSKDGIHWQDRELLLDFTDTTCRATVGDMVRSPAILWQDGRYRMWFVDNADPKGYKNVCFSESSDGFNWSDKQICSLSGKRVEPWHLDLNYIDGEYILTVYDFSDLTLWQSLDGQSFEFVKTVLSPSGACGSFYSDGLYRSSLIRDDEGLKLYFSAYDDKRTRIGLMTGDTLDGLSVYSVNGPDESFFSYFRPYLKTWKIRLWRIVQAVKGNR